MSYKVGQAEAIKATGNVLVSASAGSGKTHVMVDKVLSLIKDGADIKRMVVMTFTRAAAAEIKNRLLKELYATLRNDSSCDHIRAQIEDFPFANICTIDSFCMNLIKKHFGVIGADPSFTPYEEGDAVRLLVECIDKVCEDKLDPPDPDFIAFADRYAVGRKLDSVKGLIFALRNFVAVQPEGERIFDKDCEQNVKDYFLKYAKSRIKIGIKEVDGIILALKQAGITKFEERASILKNNITVLYEAANTDEFFAAYLFCEKEKTISDRLKDVDPEAKRRYNDFVKWYNVLIDDFTVYSNAYVNKVGRGYAKKDAKTLIELTMLAEKLYSDKKTQDKKLDFGDMGKKALQILDNPTVKEEVKGSFDYIFVDEYQDTNYLQENLINGISNGHNVFVVGDGKQAIYQFREAVPKILHDRKALYDSNGSEGTNVKLVENFRSSQEILNFVNDICSEVMTEEYCGINYREDGKMDAHYEFFDSGVELYSVPAKQRRTKTVAKGCYSVKEAEVEGKKDAQAEFVADYIVKNVKKMPIYRVKQKVTSPLEYKDVAVLVHTNTQAIRIADKLAKRNIPYNMNKAKGGVDVRRELLIDFVRLCYGEEDLAVLNVMMSPIFGFNAMELAKIRAQTPETALLEAVKSYNGEPNLQKKVDFFKQYVEKLRADAAILKVSEIMTKVLADGLEGYYISLGGDTAIRIKQFVATVKQSECDKDIADFLEFCDNYGGEKPPEKEDAVNIVTIHKSKGLQYPLVIVPYLEYRSPAPGENNNNTTKKRFLFIDRELGISFIDSDVETGYSAKSFAILVQQLKKKREQNRELARLMYVAFTRAENRLVAIGEECKVCADLENAGRFVDFVTYAESKNPAIGKYRAEFLPPMETKEEEEDEEEMRIGDNGEFGYLMTEYPFAKDTVLPVKTTVTAILRQEEAKTFDEGGFEEKGAVPEEDEEARKSYAELGTAYHLVMQRIDFNNKTEEGIASFVQGLVAQGEISADTAKKIDVWKIKGILTLPLISNSHVAEPLRELPFVMPREDGSLLQGVIDLLLEDEDGLIVVDYKASYADKNTLLSRYQKQLLLYAQAAQKITGKPVKKCVLINLLRSYEVSFVPNC